MSEPGRMDAEKGSTDERTVGLRSCGDCWRCCQDLRIGEKAPGTPCEHLDKDGPLGGGRHCGRYADRPADCRDFECLWRLIDAELLPNTYRPDSLGVIFSARLASELGLPPHGSGDWLVIVALPVYSPAGKPLAICTNATAMEAVRRLRAAGLAVMIDETASGGEAIVERPLRKPTPEFARRLSAGLEAIAGRRQT